MIAIIEETASQIVERSSSPFVAHPEVVQSWPGEVLIFTSRDDDLSFSSLEAFHAYYPRTQTHVFESGGYHALFFPELYVEALQRFLEFVALQ